MPVSSAPFFMIRKARAKMSDVLVRRLSGIGMVTLRGDIPTLAKAAGIKAPEQRMIERSDNSKALMWMSPDELLLVCEDASTQATALGIALERAFATVADVSDARAVFEVEGEGAEGVITKLMPVDFAALAPNELRRSRLAQIPAALWREGSAWRIACFRSVADYAHTALQNAANGPIPPIPS